MTDPLKILVVEDDSAILSGLEYLLQNEGFTPLIFRNFTSAQAAIAQEVFDLALLDLNLPDGSGYELCRQIKARSDVPVMFITAMDSEMNVVMGLDLGADDYITKPFRVRELLSRIHNLLRRYKKTSSQTLRFGPVEINTVTTRVTRDDEEILLTPLEYKLLLIFAAQPGRVFTRAQLLEQLWDVEGDYLNDNTLTVYIKRLREKVEGDPQNPLLITTVRGLGYKGG